MNRDFKRLDAVLLFAAATVALTACDPPMDDLKDSPMDDGPFDSLYDSRDGKTYSTVIIGDKIWMAENLNYQAGESMCYDNEPENCDKYGRLYVWHEALTVCPEGWHLPSKEDFLELRAIAGQKAGHIDKAGLVLKSTTGWADYEGKSGNGTDALGFAALPAGYRFGLNGPFYKEGENAYFWSSTEDGSEDVGTLGLSWAVDYLNMGANSKESGYSVRCIKD